MNASGRLTLKPPPHLGLPVSLLVAGAVFLLTTRSETASQVLALILVAMAAGMVRHFGRLSGESLELMDASTWRLSPSGQSLTLQPSSARLWGVLWLHGRGEAGRRVALMVLPGMVSDEDYRRLCVWYERAGSQAARDQD